MEEAELIFDDEVIQPALAARPGQAQLAAGCEAFFGYVLRRVFPGGCSSAATALETGTRSGAVKERIAAIQSGFTEMLRTFAATSSGTSAEASDEFASQADFNEVLYPPQGSGGRQKSKNAAAEAVTR